MFSLFHNLMDTFKDVEKQNRILQATLKRKQKPDQHFSQREKKSIIKETLQPYFGQDQIDIILQHQTKRVREWSKDSIFQAEILRRCMSRSSYRKLRESKIIPLPSLAALKSHLEKFGGLPNIPSSFPSQNDDNGAELKKYGSIKVVEGNGKQISPSKQKSRRQALKNAGQLNEQELSHLKMDIAPSSSSATEEIMMVPVIHSSHLPSSHHEVVLAVDSIMH